MKDIHKMKLLNLTPFNKTSIAQLLQELKTFWGSAGVSFVATDSTFDIPKISTRYLSPFALRPVATGGGRRVIFSNFIL